MKFKLPEVPDVNHNTKVYKAEIGKKKDGSPNYVIRTYTPISPPDSKGNFDLVIKIYPQGKMTQHLANLRPGDTLDVKGPILKLAYTPNKKKQIGMLAGGSGITPMLQVIDAIISNLEDNTRVFYVVSQDSQGWKGGKGHVSKDELTKGLPFPSEDTLIFLIGILKEFGYTPEQVYKF